MAEIRPFRGVHYNPELVQDLAEVICPPYDIISPRMREELYKQSEYNFVRLEFTRELPQDSPTGKYARAATDMARWLEKGILKADDKPSIYLYDQHFTRNGTSFRRRSLIVTVKLEEWDKRVVRPHEYTLSAPKSDRLNLLRALQANTSPVLGLFEDKSRQIVSLLANRDRAKPLLEAKTDGEAHRIWSLNDTTTLDGIRSALAGQPLYIADGHHRYESALNYRREKRAASPSSSVEPYDYVMMILVDFADPGLVVLPTHRLLRGIPSLDELMPAFKQHFEVEALPSNGSEIWPRVDRLWAEDPLNLVWFDPKRSYVLRLRDLAAASKMMPAGHSETYQNLNVSVVEHIILEKVLDITRDKEADRLGYSHDRQDAANRVITGEYQSAILLSPVKAEVIKDIADASDRMPRKSTYFYPKLPSGLMVYRHV
ncbi:MAG: DUF1015 domain-containing protein [Dehalococcoidales bacterium]|nr:DUF1015 domain-containing protein [Dehalococcoidales bacterium]